MPEALIKQYHKICKGPFCNIGNSLKRRWGSVALVLLLVQMDVVDGSPPHHPGTLDLVPRNKCMWYGWNSNPHSRGLQATTTNITIRCANSLFSYNRKSLPRKLVHYQWLEVTFMRVCLSSITGNPFHESESITNEVNFFSWEWVYYQRKEVIFMTVSPLQRKGNMTAILLLMKGSYIHENESFNNECKHLPWEWVY